MNIARYIEEMSFATKIVLGVIFVVVVGFILTAGWESTQEKQSMASLWGREITVDFARKACMKQLKNHVSSDIGHPTQAETDPMATTATLTWQGKDKEFKSVVCDYHKDKGVTRLSIDGVEKFGAAPADAGRASGKTAEPKQAAEEPAMETKEAGLR